MQTRRTFLTTLACGSAFALAACGGSNDGAGNDAGAADAAAATLSDDDARAKGDGVMDYAAYTAAELESEVVIEAFVQGKQSWWEDKATIYAQDPDGGYFIYNAQCTEDDYAKLVDGQKIKVTGYKTEWSGEVEIAEGGTIEIEDGLWIATAADVTDKLGSDDLISFQNQKVAFKGLKVEASDQDGKEVAFLYNYDGSGAAGDDLYFNASNGTDTFSFTVESYLTGEGTDVYKLVTETLKIGDTIDMEGFLYWYEGPNPHITSITIA